MVNVRWQFLEGPGRLDELFGAEKSGAFHEAQTGDVTASVSAAAATAFCEHPISLWGAWAARRQWRRAR